MTKYIVVTYTYDNELEANPTAGLADVDCKVYDTLAAANDAADMAWYYLTKNERARTTIDVGVVTEADLADWAVDEDDGTIDWTVFENYRIPEGALHFPQTRTD